MKNRIKLNIANLKKSIIQKRIMKSDLALEIGVTRETFSRWLAGKVEYIDENKLVRLSEILECDLSWLSPEISASRYSPAPWNPSETIGGDDFIRMGLYSGLWNKVSQLYAVSAHPNIVEDGRVNQKLCQAMHALINLDFSDHEKWSSQPGDHQKNHELFDGLARYNIIAGLASLIDGNIDEAHSMFKRVIIQARSEWLISFAYLLSGICCALQSSPKDSCETWTQGLLTFPNSQDDLTLLMQANLRLSLCLQSASVELAQVELQKAQKIFITVGYRHGYARCLSYEALIGALRNKKNESLQKIQEASSFIHRLPRLYQLEMLLLTARVHLLRKNREAALKCIQMAQELAQGHEVLLLLVNSQLANSSQRKAL